MISEIFKKYELGHGITAEIENFAGSLTIVQYTLIRFFENIQLGFMSPNITSLVMSMDMGIKKFEDLISHKVGKLHP
jgi:hypothetical protein